MERFESKVIRVSPSNENIRIGRMAIFGWSLQSRQDVVEPVSASSTTDGDEIETDIQVTHHVALHFVRPLSLPHLEEIKQLEFEYFQLESSQPQRPQTEEPAGCWSGLFGLGCIILAIVVLVGLDGWKKLWGILFVAFGVFLFWVAGTDGENVKKERGEYERKRSEWLKKREGLKQRAKSLLLV